MERHEYEFLVQTLMKASDEPKYPRTSCREAVLKVLDYLYGLVKDGHIKDAEPNKEIDFNREETPWPVR